jgi:hypothetical protein
MNLNQTRDEETLLKRAFYMHKKCLPLLKQLYVLLTSASYKDFHPLLLLLKQWLLAPFSLWPVDFRGAGQHVCIELEAGRPIDREMMAMFEFLKPVPGPEEQETVGIYEFEIELGIYDALVRNDVKYAIRMKELQENPKFRAHLELLKAIYNLDEIANGSTVLRRLPGCERNFRIKDFFFNWSNKKSRFIHVFTSFCWQHELYGLEKKDGEWVPLLMKVTVNVTPHGMIIYVPKWMSLDLKRDLIIKALTDLHTCRGTLRQGPKISESRLEKQDLAKNVYNADQAAKDKGYKGKKRFAFIMEEAKLPASTDNRRIYELINQGAEVVASEKELEAIAAIASHPAPRDTEPTPMESLLRNFNKLSPEDKDKFLKAATS